MSTVVGRSHFGTFLLGLLLLLFGILLLLSRAGVVDLDLTRVAAFAVLAVGGFESITAFAYSNQGRLFWGSVLFLAALLTLLITYGFIPGSWNRIWPSALIIPGLAFLMMFFSTPREITLLIVAVLFVVVGWSGLMAEKSSLGFGDTVMGALRFLVPIAVVAAGIYVVWRNFSRSRT